MPNFPDFDRYASVGEHLDGRLSFFDDKVGIVDRDDETKRIKFDPSGLTTGTTATIAVGDAGVIAQRKTVVSNASAVFATPVVLTAADSGKVQLLNVATGIDFTLPAITASNIGMVFEFHLIVEVTSNSYRITAGEATDLMVGHVLMFDKDTATGDANALISIFRPDVSDDDAITIAGADDTTGALVGGKLTLTAVTATRWFVEGVLVGDGSLATIFA